MYQRERLARWLKSGKSINPLTSWKQLGIYRLAARINELQKTMDIKRQWIEVENQHGEIVRVKEYWI